VTTLSLSPLIAWPTPAVPELANVGEVSGSQVRQFADWQAGKVVITI
jgi:hypothetical protein